MYLKPQLHSLKILNPKALPKAYPTNTLDSKIVSEQKNIQSQQALRNFSGKSFSRKIHWINCLDSYFAFQDARLFSTKSTASNPKKKIIEIDLIDNTISNNLIENVEGLPIRLSTHALSKLREINKILRVQVLSGGCSGFQYSFKIIDETLISSDDRIATFQEQRVVVDSSSLEYLNDCIIDHVDELIRSSFVIHQNKLAVSKCSCGHSFDIDIGF